MTENYVNTQKEAVKENMTCLIHIEINKAIVNSGYVLISLAHIANTTHYSSYRNL